MWLIWDSWNYYGLYTERTTPHCKRDRTHVLLVNEVSPSADDGFLATGHLASCRTISGISVLGSRFALKRVRRKKNPKQPGCHVSISSHGGILTSVAPRAAVPRTCTPSCQRPVLARRMLDSYLDARFHKIPSASTLSVFIFYFKQKVLSVKSLNYHLACDLAACVPEYSCFNEFPQC